MPDLKNAKALLDELGGPRPDLADGRPLKRTGASGMRLRTGRCEAGAGTFGHEALGGISSPAGSCVWHVLGLQRSVPEWAIRQGGGRPLGAAGAGARYPCGGAGDAGGALRVRRGPAGLLKYACATFDDRFRIEAQKSAVVRATATREPSAWRGVRPFSGRDGRSCSPTGCAWSAAAGGARCTVPSRRPPRRVPASLRVAPPITTIAR
jgi:hypothetical protein